MRALHPRRRVLRWLREGSAGFLSRAALHDGLRGDACRRGNGERNAEAREGASVLRRIQLEAASVPRGDLHDERQTQTKARRLSGHQLPELLEALKHFLALLGSDAGPAIADPDFDQAGLLRRGLQTD